MPYDQLLKELLRTFFAAFLEQFFPEVAARLDLSQITFLEQETVTDLGEGRRRELDLVAQVATESGSPELILVHVELQARPEPDFPWRMFEYFALLRRRHRLPVLPIVLYVTGGQGSGRWERYREEVFEELIVLFRYRRLRLKALNAAQAVKGGAPLMCALAALMDRRGADLAALKAASLQQIGQSVLDEARQWLLVNFVETYLPLPAADEPRYRQLLTQKEYTVAKQVEMTWGDRLREEGLLRAKREDILAVLQARFSQVPEEWMRRIEAIQTVQELDALLLQAVRAASLDDVRAALPN